MKFIKTLIKKLLSNSGYTIISKHHLADLNYKLESSRLNSGYAPKVDTTYYVEPSYVVSTLSNAAFKKLIEDYQFLTVLDIGAGSLEHSNAFAKYGKDVTAVDFGNSVYYQKDGKPSSDKVKSVIGDFNTIEINEKFDLIWASHVLEHQTNVDIFLKKLVSLCKRDGLIAITVPPLKHEIVGGHVSLWNAGLILYRLVLAGVDCSDAAILSQGYNISVIVRNRLAKVENIEFDCGDIRKIKPYLPSGLNYIHDKLDDPFDGNITRLNW